MDKKKKTIRLTNIIAGLLAFFVCLLFLSLYAFSNRDAIAEKAAEKAAANVIVKTPDETTPAPTALPDELINTSSKLILIDKTHNLPADYVPANLTTPYLNSSADVIELEEECAEHAKAMKKAAEEAGVQLIVSAGYVDYSTQQDMYEGMVNLIGEAKTALRLPKAGYSEHQTGLAIDFTYDASITQPSNEDFENSDTGKWLYEHAHEYGFILRYPKDKESITGYSYQPWHYRYVGKETADAMYAVSPDYTFEEYYGIAAKKEN